MWQFALKIFYTNNFVSGKFFLPVVFCLLSVSCCFAQQTSYQETFIMPGMNGDVFVIETSDGGFITTGQDESSGAGSCDIYIFKKDACGKLIWFNTYGGGGADGGSCIRQTTDGGYIVTGLFTNGGAYDMFLLKIDGVGNLQWFKTYGDGGAAEEYGLYVQQTAEGGYILTGHTRSFGAGAADVYVVKTDNSGNVQWEKTFGGGGEDVGNYIEQTSDGGYIISGATNSFGSGGYDILLIKIDSVGTIQWSKVYGGAADDATWWIVRAPVTNDGGYFISSYTASYGAGSNDIFFIKTDSAGNLQWAKTYGGAGDEQSRFSYPVNGGNLVSTGYTASFGAGGRDYYLLYTDSAGNLLWFKTYGSTGDEKSMCVQEVSDGGFVLCGNTSSTSVPFSADYYDIYFVKTDSAGNTTCYSNPATPTVNNVTPSVIPVTPTVTSPAAVAAPAISVGNYNYTLNRLCIQCYFEAKYTYCQNQLQLSVYDSSACLPTNWFWDFGDGFTATGQNPSHVYTTPGTYTVQMIAEDSTTYCVDTVINSITVNMIPVSQFSFTDNVCYGTAFQFTDSSNGNISAWYWDFGDGTYSTIQNPSHLYSAPGTYNAELRVVYDDFCTDSLTKPVNIRPIPVADFSATNVCLNVPTGFTNLSTISNGAMFYQWDLGDFTGTSIQQNPFYTYLAPAFYSPTLIVTSDYGCKDTISKSIEVFPLPNSNFGATGVCFGFNTVFTDSSTIATDTITNWYWDFGDGFTDVLQNTQHLYSSSGTYNVELMVVTNEGCSDSWTKQVIVDPLPVSGFTFMNVCEYDTAQFQNTSVVNTGTVDSSFWDLGDGNTSLLTSPSHLYPDGSYTVTLVVLTDKGCMDSAVENIVIHPVPVADFTTANVCKYDSAYFTDISTLSSGNLVNWNWVFGDGNTSTNPNPAHLYSSPATYSVLLVVTSDSSCVDSLTQQLIVFPVPVAEFTNTTVCLNEPPAVFTDQSTIINGTIVTWAWDFGDGNISSLPSSVNNYMDSGFYNVKLKVTSLSGCEDSVTHQVEVYSIPLVSFNADIAIGCAPLQVNFFNNSSNSVQYSWDFGDGSSSTSISPAHTYTGAATATAFTVSLAATSSNGCIVINTKIDTIVTLPNPIAAFSAEPNPATILFPYITFTNLASGNLDPPVKFSWDFGDSTTFNGFDTIHTYSNTDTGTYLVQLIVENAYKCRDTVTSLITIEGDYTIFVPSAFTPNGDGFNDTFFPKGIGVGDPDFQFTLSIYDRWGDLVYKTDDPAKPWDGKANKGGKIAQEDVYVWMITTQDNTETVGKKHQYFGHVTLIR